MVGGVKSRESRVFIVETSQVFGCVSLVVYLRCLLFLVL